MYDEIDDKRFLIHGRNPRYLGRSLHGIDVEVAEAEVGRRAFVVVTLHYDMRRCAETAPCQ